ncbi:hypothetical protein Tco_0146313 [Tanacetum coccineum]
MLAPSGGGLILYQAYGNLYAMTVYPIGDSFVVKPKLYTFSNDKGRFQPERLAQLDTVYGSKGMRRGASEWFKKDCIGLVTTWEDLVEKFVQKFYQLSYDNEEMKAEENDEPNDIAEIFKIKGNLFDYETPLTYEEYELNNTMTRDLEEPCSDIDGFCNGGELPGMVRVRSMTYFHYHKWYDELVDGKLKEETLIHKVKVEESWGNATLGGHEERRDDPTLEPSVCKIRRFEMMKYSFNVDEEYIAIKESDYLNHSSTLP